MKAKNCIKSSVIKLSALSDLVEKDIENQLEPAQLEAALLSLQPNVDIDSRHIVTCEMSTQTPPSIPNEFAGEEIRDLFSDPDKHGELLVREWPKAAFLRTTMTRGGLFKILPGTARAVLATASTLKSNEFLRRLGLSHPILKSLDENSLPPGKTATIKCGVEMTIDGECNGDDSQYIIVGSLPSIEDPAIMDMIRKISDQVRGKTNKILIAFPPELDCERARKLTEICAKDGLFYEIPTSKKQRVEHLREVRKRNPRPKLATMTLRPTRETTLADIVKGLHDGVNPQEMGVNIRYVRETKAGSVQDGYNENTAAPAFFNKVKEALATKATCQARERSIQLYDIELGSSEKELLACLAHELMIGPTDLTCDDIKSSPRGRTLVVKMDAGLIPRALQIRSLGGGWPLARIREMVDPEFCDKCQIFGHPTRHCTSTTQSVKRCINCAQTGHLRTDCTNDPACFVLITTA